MPDDLSVTRYLDLMFLRMRDSWVSAGWYGWLYGVVVASEVSLVAAYRAVVGLPIKLRHWVYVDGEKLACGP